MLFHLATWHWFCTILLYQMCCVLSHPIPAIILFQVQVIKILMCQVKALPVPAKHTAGCEGKTYGDWKRPRQKQGCVALGAAESGPGGHRRVAWPDRMGAARKQLEAPGAEMGERQTAQREATEEAFKSRGEPGQSVDQGNNWEMLKGPRCLRAINLNE